MGEASWAVMRGKRTRREEGDGGEDDEEEEEEDEEEEEEEEEGEGVNAPADEQEYGEEDVEEAEMEGASPIVALVVAAAAPVDPRDALIDPRLLEEAHTDVTGQK